jgi:hypothetical protein
MRRNRVVGALLYLVLGGGFVLMGILRPEVQFIAFLGAVFIFFGLYTLTQLPKFKRSVSNAAKT